MSVDEVGTWEVITGGRLDRERLDGDQEYREAMAEVVLACCHWSYDAVAMTLLDAKLELVVNADCKFELVNEHD